MDYAVVGLPRPLAELKGILRPIPWSQYGTNWGNLDLDRASAAEKDSLCLLCGEFVGHGYVVWYLVAANHETQSMDPEAYVSHEDLDHTRITDNGALHERCAKLTAAHCPTLKEDIAMGKAYLMPYHYRSVLYGLA